MRTGKILGAYSLVYFLAFLAKVKHFTLLSSLLFLFLAVFLYVVEKKEEKTTLPLSGIFALGLFGGEGISVLQLSTLSSSWTNSTWLSFYFCYFFFYFFYHLFAVRKQEPEQKDSKMSQEGDARFLKTCVMTLLSISYVSFLIEAIVLGYVPLFTEHTPHAYSAFHLKILLVSRFQLIFSIVLFLFVLLLTGYRLHWKKLCLLFLFLGISYIILTIERAHSVSYLLDIFAMKNKNMPIVFVQPYMYIANNYENFNLLTKNLEVHSYGFKMAYPFFTLTGLKFFLDIPLSYPLYLTKEELSTLTILYDAYYDFGLFGVALFSSVLGGIAAWLKSCNKSENPFIMAILAQFTFYLFFSFFTTWFSNASVIFYFGITLFFALLWRLRRNGKNKER